MKIVLTGGTGFIGKSLLQALMEAGHQVILLTRNPQHGGAYGGKSVEAVYWDGRSLGEWASKINGADAVINLAGENIVARRWSAQQKKNIQESRISATQAIVEAIGKSMQKPSLLINASVVGYYGHVEAGEVDELYPSGKGFVAETCVRWEEAARSVERLGVRLILLRIGVVLEKGGALKKMLPPFQMFLGGSVGSGLQWFPWIHRDDVIGIILFLLSNSAVRGPVNAVSPEPVTMKEFCSVLGKVLRRPSWLPVPSLALRLLLGEMSDLLFHGQRAVPQKMLSSGYSFRYPKLESALRAILGK